MYEYRWNSWNLEKLAKHGVWPEEAQFVVDQARPPFPQYRGDGKWAVWGQTPAGRYLQVVYIIDNEGTLFVIHARPLERREKRRFRRRMR